jgi:hypothetical protein
MKKKKKITSDQVKVIFGLYPIYGWGTLTYLYLGDGRTRHISFLPEGSKKLKIIDKKWYKLLQLLKR